MRAWLSGVWGVLRTASHEFGRDNGSVYAGAIAFATALALVPIALLAISVTGHLLGHSSQARMEVDAALRQVLPGETSEQVVSAIKAYSLGNRLLVNAVGFLGLLWSGTNLFAVLSMILSNIWIGHRERSFWAQRLVGLLALAAAGVVFFANILVASAVAALRSLQERPGLAHYFDVIGPVLPYLVSVVIATVTFFLVYRFLPRGHVSTRAALVGAVPAAVLWLASRSVFSVLVTGSSHYGHLYGPLAGAVVLLLWIYYSAYIMIFCAELGAAAQGRYWPEEERRAGMI